MTTAHTPEQARALWCPMVRIARDESITIEKSAIGDIVHATEQRHVVAGCNTDALGSCGGRRSSPDHTPLASCRCIADKCAMWRWASKVEMHQTERASIPVKIATNKGFCGIAGRPEVTA